MVAAFLQGCHHNALSGSPSSGRVHAVFRIMGWCLLVAVLLGVLWPERPDHGPPTAVGSLAGPRPTPSTALTPGPIPASHDGAPPVRDALDALDGLIALPR